NDVDLRVTKTESADPVGAGSGPGNLTYVVTAANVGLTNATFVTLSDLLRLPAGVTVDSVTPSAGSVITNTVTDYTWNLGSLAVGGSATLTLVLTVGPSTSPGTDGVGDTATVTGASENLVNTADDSDTERTSVQRVVDLHLTKSDGGLARAKRGDVIVYTLTYGNAGPSDATGVVLTETLPANTTIDPVSLAQGRGDAGNGRFTLLVGSLLHGTSNQTTFRVKVNAAVPLGTNLIGNTAGIADDGSAVERNPADNVAQDTTRLNILPVGQSDSYRMLPDHL